MRAFSKVPSGHLIGYDGERFVTLYGWGFPTAGGDWKPFGGDPSVRDYGPAEKLAVHQRRWGQTYRRRLLQVLITKHDYHLLGTWAEADLRHETKRYVRWFWERRFRSELAKLVDEKLVMCSDSGRYSGPIYKVTSLGVVEAARLGMCKYPYI